MSDFNPTATYLPIPGYDGYLVGDDGSVWSRKNNHGKLTDQWKRLKPATNGKGYLVVAPCVKRKRWTVPVSRLVLIVFVGPCPPGMEACHKDDDRRNNRLSNLEWDTHQKNVEQRNRRGRQARGEGNASAKLKATDIPNVFLLSALGFSQRRIARLVGIAPSGIGNILLGRKWKHASSFT